MKFEPVLVGLILSGASMAQVDLTSYLRLDGTQLDLRSVAFGDGDLAALSGPAFSSVQQVLLARSTVADGDLVYLRNLKLTHLDLFGTKITDAGLKSLRELPLRGLVLTGTLIT